LIIFIDIWRGWSRAQHVRDRKADIDGRKIGGGALVTLERRRPKGRADELSFTVFFNPSMTANRNTTFSCTYTLRNCSKITKK